MMKINKQMKKMAQILSVLAFFCLSAVDAAEMYGKVIPEQSPGVAQVKSAANAEGAVVELVYRADIKRDVLALRQRGGERQYLYHRNPVGRYPAVPEITEAIHWLTPDSFVCVADGRLNSYYTLYCLQAMDDAPGTMHVWKEAEGCCHFRVEWRVQEGQLIGSWEGKPYLTISPLSRLAADNK